MNFEELGLNNEILRAVAKLGFETPTLIQEKTIPAILDTKQDLIGLAQTGTGKTAAFGLPIIQQINANSSDVQALILCPTRELGMQISNDLITYSKYTNNFKVVPVYGGTSISEQIKDIKKGCQVVVGTPGRTLDLIRRKVLKLKNIAYLVLDEADEMLNMGFTEDLNAILAETSSSKQTLLYSATMPDEIRKIANKYMNNPVEITAGKKNTGTKNVLHVYYVTLAKDKYNALKRIVDINPDIYSIVFCRTRRETKDIANKLMHDGYNADALHGDLSQSQRDFVMNRFRLKHLQILVATDVAARGLDVDDVTHIINFNPPDDNEIYIHRSGRTGRAGKKGISVSLIHTKEHNKIKDLEKMVGQKFEQKYVPNGKEICGKQLFNLIDRVEKIEVDNEQINQFLPEIYKKLEWMSKEELIQHFVSAEFNRFFEYYKNTMDINADIKSSGTKGGRQNKNYDQGEYARFYINIGSKNNLTAPKMIGLINDNCNRRDIQIGRIDIMKGFSFFEVDKSYEDLILKSFRNKTYDKVALKVEPSLPDTRGGKKNKGKRGRKR
jgi:ATP-dependent RNA helicase DeaD